MQVAGRGRYRPGFVFRGVSVADAEKLADLEVVTIRGKVEQAILVVGTFGPSIRLVLDDVRVEGKKLMPSKPGNWD